MSTDWILVRRENLMTVKRRLFQLQSEKLSNSKNNENKFPAFRLINLLTGPRRMGTDNFPPFSLSRDLKDENQEKGTSVWHKKLFAIVKAKWHRFCVAANLISPSRSFAVFLSHQKINHPRSTFHLICVNNGTPCEAERVEVQTTEFAWTADESNWLRRKFTKK